jgi:hypothetical protein
VLTKKGYLFIRDKESAVSEERRRKRHRAYFSNGLYFMKFREIEERGSALF